MPPRIRGAGALLACAAWAAHSPDAALACAVCFSPDNRDVARAYTWGIFVLASFTFLILGALGYAMHRIEVRRAASLRLRDAGHGPWTVDGRSATREVQEAVAAKP